MYSSKGAADDYLEENDYKVDSLPEDFTITSPNRDEPPYVKFSLPPIFKKKANSTKRMLWCIGFDGQATWTMTGTEGAKMRIIIKDVVLNKSGRDIFQQAYLYCVKEFKDKIDKNYREDGDEEEPLRLGMKGEVYEKGCIEFPAIATTKLDGVRGLLHPVRDGYLFRSYSGKDIGHLTHIFDDLKNIIELFPEGTTLDGEIYCHGMELKKIRGLVGQKVNKSPDIKKLQYWIYDAIWDDETPYDDRSEGYIQIYEEYIEKYGKRTSIKVLPPKKVYSHEDVMELVDKAESRGFEGVCLKHSIENKKKSSESYRLSMYNYATRSKATFKCKRYESAEGLVVGLEDCTGNEQGLPKLLVKIMNGSIIPIRFGSFEERRDWAEDPDLVLGKILEYKYFCIDSESDLPQQPTGKCFRDPE